MTSTDRFIAEWLDDRLTAISARTSGSTGTPKDIALAKTDVAQSALATISFFDLNPGHLLALPLSPGYIAGKMMIARALISGATLWTEPPTRHPLASLPAGVTVRLAAIVPQQIDGLIAAPCTVENVIAGGGPVDPDTERLALRERPSTAWWATYGMTETCSHVALRRFGQPRYRGLPGVTFSLGDGDRLVISRAGAAWSPVVTNDVVELIDDTSFVFRGRADNAIISGGIKIHPEEVERLLAPAMEGRRFYIAARASAEWGQEAALVIEGPRDDAAASRLLDAAARLAGRIMRPRSVIWLDSFPLTPSDKIIRQSF